MRGRQGVIDKSRLIELNQQGLNDAEIAKALGVTCPAILYHRKQIGLRSSGRKYSKGHIKQNLLKDGFKECPKEEMQSFLRHVHTNNKGHPVFYVSIPKQIVLTLGIELNDILLIAIKKASLIEVQEYNIEPSLVKVET